MGFALLPLVVLSFLLGIIAIERSHGDAVAPQRIELHASHSGLSFIAYRNAVAIYQRANPAFIGSVPNADLAAQGSQFSAAFLATAGNSISATGISGRTITSFAALPTGSLPTVLEVSEQDASIGISQGAYWTSLAKTPDFTPIPVLLSAPVPDGSVVSVVQIGN